MEKILLEKVNQVVDQLKSDDKLREQFKKEPIPVLEQILGVDLPDEAIEKVAAAVKANLSAEDVGSLLSAAKKLFSK